MPRASLHPPVRAVFVLLILALAAGCGPDTREASIAVLIVAGAVVVLANAVVGLLWLLWRRVRPELRLHWLPFVPVGMVLSAVGLLAAALPSAGAIHDYVAIALWAVGTSYLTFLLVVWRLRVSTSNGLVVAHAIAGTLMFAPALPLAFVGSTEGELHKELLVLWTFPGYGGMVSGPLFALLLVEALVRWSIARSRG